MENRFNLSIDTKNVTVLRELENDGIQIDFEVRRDFKYWAVQDRPKYVIAAPDLESNPESLAHELLHIWIENRGFLSTKFIMTIFGPYNCCFDSQQLPTWQNNLAHCKMISKFKDLGYPIEKFLTNYGNDFIISDLLPLVADLKVRNEFYISKEVRPTIKFLTDFISVILSTKNFEILNRCSSELLIDHATVYKELLDIDGDLFDSIYNVLTKWVDSESYSNFVFYSNLTTNLFNLGYPLEVDWSKWELEK